MKTKCIEEMAWKEHPYTWRNNRGGFKTERGYITFGIPDPPRGGKPDSLKGGDRIGWTTIEITPEMIGKKLAVFTNIEIKGQGDTLKKGQKDWHNLVLTNGGISKIYSFDGERLRITPEVIA